MNTPPKENHSPPSFMDTIMKMGLLMLAVNFISKSLTSHNQTDVATVDSPLAKSATSSIITREQALLITEQQRQQQAEQEAQLKSLFGMTPPSSFVTPTFPTHDIVGNPLGAQKLRVGTDSLLDIFVYLSFLDEMEWGSIYSTSTGADVIHVCIEPTVCICNPRINLLNFLCLSVVVSLVGSL